jgi:hypothetical protein
MAVIMTVLASTVTASPAVLDNPTSDTYLFIFTLLGALMMSGGVILLNPELETRREIVGRAIIALMCGIALPQIYAMWHDGLDLRKVKPVVLAFAGGVCTAIPYVLAKPVVRWLFSRAKLFAEQKGDATLRKFGVNVPDPVKTETEKPDKTNEPKTDA